MIKDKKTAMEMLKGAPSGTTVELEDGVRATAFTLASDPESCEKYKKLCQEIIDLLQARTSGPPEAIILLKIMGDCIKDACGIESSEVFQVEKGSQITGGGGQA